MPFDSQPAASTTAHPALRGYRCCECDTVTHLSDLNDDMVCEACCPRQPTTWVPRRHLLEG
jgi:hypothetical protein